MSLVGQNGDTAAKQSGDIASSSVTTTEPNKGVKRPAEDDPNTDSSKKQETESNVAEADGTTDEEQPTFKLNPPTLIHGVAKPAPRTEENETSEAEEKPLLRPSMLQNNIGWSNPFLKQPATSAADSTSEEKTEETKEDKTKVNFIKLSSGETDRETGFGVFGTFTDSHLHKFTSEQKETKTQEGEKKENYFLQFSKPEESNAKDEEQSVSKEKEVSSSSTSSTSSSNTTVPVAAVTPKKDEFVFGQNINARVTSPPKQEGELQSAGQFVFGENLSGRIKKEPETTEPTVKSSPDQSSKSLKESAEEMEKARANKRVKFEEVEVLTGEEGEENVVQVPCKLHIFQKEKQIWEERGRGLLRLNDKSGSGEAAPLESRIILRAQGSLRVLLNAKVWPGMIVEKVNSKNIRISALDGETGSMKIYLITATPNDAEHIFQGLDYRVQALKAREADEGKDYEKKGDEDSSKDSLIDTTKSESGESESCKGEET